MGLIKLFILLVLAYVALTFWRQMKAAQADRRRSTPQQQAPKMVRCAQCHVHLPEHLAIRDNDQWYCCSEHRDVARQD